MSFNPPGAGAPVFDAGADSLLFHQSFEGTNVAADRWLRDVSTQTVAQASGFLTLNASASLVDVTSSLVKTYRTFPLYGTAPVCAEMWLKTAGDTDAGSKAEWGIGFPATGGGAVVTDGAFFRLSVISGVPQLQGVLVANAAETTVQLRTGSATLPAASVLHRYAVEVRRDVILFVIDSSPAGSIAIPSGQPFASSASTAPIFAAVTNIAGSAVARQVNIGAVAVYLRSTKLHKPWGHQASGMGLSSIQLPPASVAGQTANYANSAAPGSASLSNTAAGYSTLGGQYQFAAVATNETDWQLFSFVNPPHSETLSGRTLYVTGIRIGEMVVTGAAAVNATTFFWGAGVGSVVSLAATDTATQFGTRRIALGAQTFLAAAALGTIAPGFAVDFSAAPLVVPAGCRFNVFLKQLNGAATVSLIWRGSVAVMGYFE